MLGAPEAELLLAWAPDPWHKLLARGGAGLQSWGTGAVPWGGHSPAASWAGKHQLTLGFQHHWLLLWCCSWPRFHSAPGQLLEAKGLDLPLLLIPVSDGAFPNGRARFGQTDITAQPSPVPGWECRGQWHLQRDLQGCGSQFPPCVCDSALLTSIQTPMECAHRV